MQLVVAWWSHPTHAPVLRCSPGADEQRRPEELVMKNPNRGRVYRRCACRAADGRQLGARCPKLTNRKHGAWNYAVDLPTLDSKRRTRRRSGFATKADAQVALSKVLEYERTGIVIDDRQSLTTS
jgi:hypothetical protein